MDIHSGQVVSTSVCPYKGGTAGTYFDKSNPLLARQSPMEYLRSLEVAVKLVVIDFKENMHFAVFKQKHFYYKFNLQSIKFPNWYGSRICVKKYLKSPQWLRNLKFKKRPFWRIDKLRLNNIIEDGGWHFCNLKTPENLLYKYKNLCETNDPINFKEKIDEKYLDINEIKKRVVKGEDIIGRDDNFKKVPLNSSFPNYLIENIKKYKDWIDE